MWSAVSLTRPGIHRSPRKVRSARQRRRATDQHLTQRARQLGFATLQAYLLDRTTQQAWTLTHIASELRIHSDTVSDRQPGSSSPGRRGGSSRLVSEGTSTQLRRYER